MPKKAGGKTKTKKSASRRPAKKAAKKKLLKKKSLLAKKPAKKKTTKKKAIKKRAARKTAREKAETAVQQAVPPKPVMVEPGPPPRDIPPVEEPASHEEAVATVTHYYSHLSVAIAQLNKGVLRIGDTIHIKGHSTDFTQAIESMEYEHQPIEQAVAGQSVGIKVKDHAREHDIVYRVK